MEVLRLKSLTKLAMLTPSWPSCVPSGGPADAIWAGIFVRNPPESVSRVKGRW